MMDKAIAMTCALIRTEFIYPPIPIRSCDWTAILDDYEPGDPIGCGTSEIEAIENLLEQLEEKP